MASDLSGLDLLVIQIDGIHMDENLILVAAIGVDAKGATSIRSASLRVRRKMPRPVAAPIRVPRPARLRTFSWRIRSDVRDGSSKCIKETLNRYLPLPSSATKPGNSVEPTLQIIARNRVRPRRSHKPSRSNLHSANPPYPLPRFPYLGGFRPPAAGARPTAMRSRHPKPLT